MSDFKIAGLFPLIEPRELRSGTKIVGYCEIVLSGLRLAGCSIAELPTGELRLWAPQCHQRPGQPMAAIRLGPQIMEEAGEACREPLEGMRRYLAKRAAVKRRQSERAARGEGCEAPQPPRSPEPAPAKRTADHTWRDDPRGGASASLDRQPPGPPEGCKTNAIPDFSRRRAREEAGK